MRNFYYYKNAVIGDAVHVDVMARKGIISVVWTLGLGVFFVWVTTTNLDNYRIVTDDDAWIMSVSYKLVNEGVLGSDLFTGFFNAERHYFISLPFYHILQTISFKLAGVGIAQARYVNVLSAIVLLWLISWLTYHWYGLQVAVVTGLLLVFWRSYLVGGGYYGYGNTLLEVARTGRYDLPAVMLIWLSILLLDQLLRYPNWMVALTLGICCGLAALTQFFGLFVLPLIIAVWAWSWPKILSSDSSLVSGLSSEDSIQTRRRRNRINVILRGIFYSKKQRFNYSITFWIILGFIVSVLPYALYMAYHWADAMNQTLILKHGRTQFEQYNFYLDNLIREPHRYIWAGLSPQSISIWPVSVSRPFGLGPWLMLIGIWPGLFHFGYRLKKYNQMGDRIVLSSFFIFFASLALLDSTKAPIYAILLLPSIYIIFAVCWVELLNWWRSLKMRSLLVHLASGGLIVGLPALVFVEGMGGYWIDHQQAVREANYLNVGREINVYVEHDARILGLERWWWTLNDHPYLSINNLFGRWAAQANSSKVSPEFADMVDKAQIDVVIVDDNLRGNLSRKPDELQNQFWKLIKDCNILVAELNFKSYGVLEVYQIKRACKFTN